MVQFCLRNPLYSIKIHGYSVRIAWVFLMSRTSFTGLAFSSIGPKYDKNATKKLPNKLLSIEFHKVELLM